MLYGLYRVSRDVVVCFRDSRTVIVGVASSDVSAGASVLSSIVSRRPWAARRFSYSTLPQRRLPPDMKRRRNSLLRFGLAKIFVERSPGVSPEACPLGDWTQDGVEQDHGVSSAQLPPSSLEVRRRNPTAVGMAILDLSRERRDVV